MHLYMNTHTHTLVRDIKTIGMQCKCTDKKNNSEWIHTPHRVLILHNKTWYFLFFGFVLLTSFFYLHRFSKPMHFTFISFHIMFTFFIIIAVVVVFFSSLLFNINNKYALVLLYLFFVLQVAMKIFNHKFICASVFVYMKKWWRKKNTTTIKEWKQMANFIASDTKQRKTNICSHFLL